MTRWRLYYGDGTTSDSDREHWVTAPAWNVQVLVTPDDFVGRELDTGKLAYLWWPGATKPWGVDAVGLFDFLRTIHHAEANKPLSMIDFNCVVAAGVKFGRSVDNQVFRMIMDAANHDQDFLKKTGTLAHERRDG